MSRSDTHRSPREKLDTRLEAAFQKANADRDLVKTVKNLACKWPLGQAAHVVEDMQGAVSRMMDAERARAAELYEVDITVPAEPKGPGRVTLEEGASVMRMADNYLVYQELHQKLAEYSADRSLSEKDLISRVCEAYIEAIQTKEAALLHGLQEISVKAREVASNKTAEFADDALRTQLAGHLATRISLGKNRRLAKALNDIREHNKPARRERFEVLLRELYDRARDVWAKHHVTDKRLLATRNAVVMEITGREAERKGGFSGEQDLADFVTREAREALLKQGREVGLPPREYEVFRFFVEHPGAKNAAAARALGIAEGTVKSYKSRIKQTINTA